MDEITPIADDEVAVDIEDLGGVVSQQSPPVSSFSSEDEGEKGHIDFPAVSEDDDHHISFATSEDDEEGGHIPFSTSEDEGKESNVSSFPLDNWASSIKERSLRMPKKLKASSASESCSIHRVPCNLRKHNMNAYDPQLISIGPFHYGKRKDQLLAMEEHKWSFLHDFISNKSSSWLARCLSTVESLEKKARYCYSEVITLDSVSFVEMLVLDGCFLIEFLRRVWLKDWNDVVSKLRWPRAALFCDLLLMENQIPFFILQHLYDPRDVDLKDASGRPPSLVEIALNFIFPDPPSTWAETINDSDTQIHHLLHLQHAVYVLFPSIKCPKPDDQKDKKCPGIRFRKTDVNYSAFLGIIKSAKRVIEIPCIQRQQPEDHEENKLPKNTVRRIPCASKLVEAGIRFRKRDANDYDFLDIKFAKGVIEIPRILVSDVTKIKFLNLIAFEQCYHHLYEKRITTYAIFMDCLIDTAKDVEILSKKGIICNAIGDDELVASDFNNIAREAIISTEHFYLSEVGEEINRYSKKCLPRWRASLVHKYFNTPWALVSVLGALLLLLIGLVQILFALYPKLAIGK